MEFELEQLRNQVYQLERNIENLNGTVANLEMTLSNQRMMLEQSMNMQIALLNQMSQSLLGFNSKLADIDVRSNYTDDSMKELVDANNGIVQELQEIKSSVDAMKFYALGHNPSQY